MVAAPICNATLITGPPSRTARASLLLPGPRPAVCVLRQQHAPTTVVAREPMPLIRHYAALVALNGFQSPNNC